MGDAARSDVGSVIGVSRCVAGPADGHDLTTPGNEPGVVPAPPDGLRGEG
jgi:hypothetical protein